MIDFVPDRVAAGADFAFRKDSAALVTLEGDGVRVCLTSDREWRPGATPLRPSSVIGEAALECLKFGITQICADLHYIETVREITDKSGISLIEFPSDPEKIAAAYVAVRVMIGEGKLDLSRASAKLVTQLKETIAKPTAAGGLSIMHKRTAAGHGDLASALVAAVYALDKAGATTLPGNASRRFGRAPAASEWREFAPDD